MELVYGFMDFIGITLAIAFVFYWAYAGNLLLHNEKRIWLKIVLFGALFTAPPIMPLVLYAFYYEPFNRRLRTFFSVKNPTV